MSRVAGAGSPAALLVIVAVALAVRLWGISFGLPHVRVRPDELFILGTVIKMHAGQPNPGFFDYPGLYMYLVAGLYALYYGIGLASGWFSGSQTFAANFSDHWEPYFLIPRTAGAVFGAATVAVVHSIAATVLDRRAALASSLFLALAFLHVRDSHYATTDVPMTFFIMAAVLAAVRVQQSRRSKDAWLAGALAGCAASTKYNAVLVVLVLAAVETLHAWDLRGDWRRIVNETHLFRMAAACLFVFAVTNPYLVLDARRALRDLEVLGASTASGMTPPEWLGRGWTYHLPYSLRYGLGLPLVAGGLAGFVWIAWRQPRTAIVLGIFPATYYAVAGVGYNVFVRYMVPVVPFLCIFAGFAVAEFARFVAARVARAPEAALVPVCGLLLVAPSAWSVVRFDRLAAREDNRVTAARWVHDNVPVGSTILMTGNLYGHPQLERGPVARYRYMEFDYRRTRRFLADGRPTDQRPDWIIVQRHPIPYANPAPEVMALVNSQYELVHTLRAYDPGATNFYDIQDGFYAPFGGFKGVRRFGPNFEIYRRRSV